MESLVFFSKVKGSKLGKCLTPTNVDLALKRRNEFSSTVFFNYGLIFFNYGPNSTTCQILHRLRKRKTNR